MNIQNAIDYKRVAEAIEYIRLNFKKQPGLDEIAQKINISPFHFQRLFTEWVGVSPKKFLQYVSVEYAKSVLKQKEATLVDVAYDTGLSGTGRLHDLFVKIEGMTPGEFKDGGKSLVIHYNSLNSPFGNILIASTYRGVCYLGFVDDEKELLHDLCTRFPNAQYKQTSDEFQQNALRIFTGDWTKPDQVKLHLRGTNFQLKVWNALLKIPLGKLSTYGEIANSIHNPKASRAVGSAIGDNPVAFLIPCHRVIRSSGVIGEYYWGSTRKTAMIGWEAAQVNSNFKTEQ